MTSIPHIGVVGAGIAGLRCAAKLCEHGFKVDILEARGRVGGRICQSNKLGYPIDLGPQWIHTSGDNPLLDIAKETGTPLHSWNEYINLYDLTGKLVSNDKAVEIDELRWKLIQDAIEYSAEYSEHISKHDSLYDFVEKRAKEILPSPDDQALLLGMLEMWGDYIGDPVHRQSLKFAYMEECCGGGKWPLLPTYETADCPEELIVTSTFAAILDHIVRAAPPGRTIHHGQKVVAIVVDGAQANAPPVTLLTSNDGFHKYDAVVMTTPLGWLKRNLNAFKPALDDRVVKAIDSISVGHLEKVYITFPKAFWQEDPGKPVQIESTPKVMQSTEREFAGYTNWIAPGYTSASNPKKWPQEAYNLAAFAEPHRHPTLLFYQYGEQSAYITDKVKSMSAEEHHDFLKGFFRPYYSRLQNFDEADPDCQPRAILSTSWYQDELSGYGSYCNFQVGIDDARGDVEALRIGCPDRRIWFAGEHCAPFDEMGTVTGAYLSGEATAERVVEAFAGK